MFLQTPNGKFRSNSSVIVSPSRISATLKDPSAQTAECIDLSASLSPPCHFSRILPSVKRKLLDDQCVLLPPKTSLPRNWQPPPFSRREAKQSASVVLQRAKPTTLSTELVGFPAEALRKSGAAPRVLEEHTNQPALKQSQRPFKRKRAAAASKETPPSCVFQSLGKIKPTFVSDQALKLTRTLHEDTDGGKTQNQSKARYSSAFLTSDPRVKDCGILDKDQQNEMLQKAKGTKAVMLTLVYRDGTSLLDPEQVSYRCTSLCVSHSVVVSFYLKQEQEFCRVESRLY